MHTNSEPRYKEMTERIEKLNKEAMFYFRVGIVVALIFAIAYDAGYYQGSN